MTLAHLAKYVASTMSSLISKLISLRMFSTIYIRKLIYGLGVLVANFDFLWFVD